MLTAAGSQGADAAELLRVLTSVWGYAAFRPLQLEAIQATLSNKDVLLVLATGGGKSLAFQVPPLTKAAAVTVAVCPLIALAKVTTQILWSR